MLILLELRSSLLRQRLLTREKGRVSVNNRIGYIEIADLSEGKETYL